VVRKFRSNTSSVWYSLFGRVDKLMAGVGHGNPAVDITAYVLAVLLIVSLAMFLVSIYLTNKNAKST
jgi:hypothetical protein